MTLQPLAKKTIDDALEALGAAKDAWVALGIDARIAVLDEIRKDLAKVADRWIAASIAAKGIPAGTHGEGEEWAMLGCVFRQVRLLRASLGEIRRSGRPRVPGFTLRPDGQVAARVFPKTMYDHLIYHGVTGEIRMEPGVTLEEVLERQARNYRDRGLAGKIVAVLGAGNASCLVPGDFLSKLFVEDRVVVLKTNPVNAYLGPLLEEGFAALVQRGFLRIVAGGAAAGTYLCRHPAVDEIHMTGSDKTFESIVVGPGAEGARRKAERRPLLTKRFTAELGNITPVIIVPGPWSDADVREQAVAIASWHVANAACNCHTPRLIIQQKGWPQREALVKAVGEALAAEKTRTAYYPGAQECLAAFLAAHPGAGRFGDAAGDRTPWTFIADADPDNTAEVCFSTEAYCSLMAETALASETVPAFLDRATTFANTALWGTLHAGLVVHPRSLADPQTALAVERALDRLRYGTIGVNLRADYLYSTMVAPWGGFPHADSGDIQSGRGFTNNVLMFDKLEKAVFRGPFRKRPDPTAITSPRVVEFYRKLASFEASPSPWKLGGLLWTVSRS